MTETSNLTSFLKAKKKLSNVDESHPSRLRPARPCLLQFAKHNLAKYWEIHGLGTPGTAFSVKRIKKNHLGEYSKRIVNSRNKRKGLAIGWRRKHS